MNRMTSRCAILARGTVRLVCALALLPLIGSMTAASATEPRVPPAPTTAGVAIALLGPGVDYRAPELVGQLARDGEGDLIAWDFLDGDIRPFEVGGTTGTERAKAIAARAPDARLVIVKEMPGDPQAFGHMMTFVARTPARVIVWPDAAPARPDWAILLEAVKRFPDHLFLLPRPPGGAGVKVAGLADLDAAVNVVTCPLADQAAVMDCLARAAAAATKVMTGTPQRSIAEIRNLIGAGIVRCPPADRGAEAIAGQGAASSC
jgi:hypothetical protein